MDQREIDKAQAANSALNEVSSSFCAVRWKHATLNFSSGASKSCCHLPFQKMDADLTKQFEHLHDNKHDQQERQMMLEGVRPKDCSYCWWIEDQGGLSDRILWSSKSWMFPYIDQIKKNPNTKSLSPSWLELNFSNVCNLKCSYCSPIFSTSWLQEIKQHGPYPTSPPHNDLEFLPGVEFKEKYDSKQLLEKFWPWFEKIYSELRLLKITGGEPLLNPSTFEVLNWLNQNNHQDLILAINSNLNVAEKNWSDFIEKIIPLIKNKKIYRFNLHPSIDSYGAQAEYIRHGLNFSTFQKNVENYLERTGGNLVFICTVNNLSLRGLKDLWSYLLDLKKKFGPRGQWVSMTTEVLYGPEWQNINILPHSLHSYFHETIRFIENHLGDDLVHFSRFELLGLQKAYQAAKSKPVDLLRAQKNFYLFFSEHDRRRSSNLIKTFPELKEFWDHCRDLQNSNTALHST